MYKEKIMPYILTESKAWEDMQKRAKIFAKWEAKRKAKENKK